MSTPLPLPGLASRSQRGSGLYLQAKIGGSDSCVLVDTGAEVSIIPKAIWLSLTKGGGELEEYLGETLAANGGPMCVVGRWHTVCQFDSLALIIDFLVADVPIPDILLGSDVLTKYGAVIDLGSQCCRLLGRKLPLLSPSDASTPRTVTVGTDIIVPPRSEFIISGVVKGLIDGCGAGMLEPSGSLSKHSAVFVARVICNVKQGLVPVRVINVTEDPLPLRQGMKVGTLFTDITVMDDSESKNVLVTHPWPGDSLIKELGLEEKGLSPAQLQSVHSLLQRHSAIFSTGDSDLGRTHLTTHQIDTGNAKPIKMGPRRVPLHIQQEVSDEIKRMQDSGVIRPSCSPWAAPIVPVRKKGGALRFCVDYRKLNDVTAKDAYPLPRIDDALDSLANATLFSTLDLASGYWQVEVDPKDRHKTAFATRQGLFEFNVLSFGLCNAPSTFQRLMDLVLADLQWATCLVYLDDIIVFGRNFTEHLSRLDEVLSKLGAANLKVKPSKCDLFATQVKYLGHIISAEGIRADPAKVESVREWPVPKTQTEVKSFIGLASYYRRFVKGFADIARPLHQLTEKGKKFRWGDDCQEAFVQLKSRLITAPVLAYPDPQKMFVLDTDASDVGIGAVLSQESDDGEHVVAYASRALSKEERRYATTKKELLAMVTFTKFFKHYLLGKEFILRTDHGSLRWLHNFQGLEGQLARWVEQLASFNYKIVHRPGKQHVNADALSRLPAFTEVTSSAPTSSAIPLIHQQQSAHLVGAVHTQVQQAPALETEDELVKAQQGDDEVRQLIQLKALGTVNLNDKPELKHYATVWEQLQMQNQRLVRIPPERSDAEGAQVVLPRSMVSDVLSTLHNSITGGHLGINKLQARVKDRFYWPGWFGDVRKWCRECVDCGSRKDPRRAPLAPLVQSAPSRPYERIALDVLGPLPETLSKNKYVLVIGDYFSKWTEAFAIPNQEAPTVARVLAEQWVCRYGTARSIHSDQGRNFESNVFKELCALLDINKTRTSPYHPQSDGLIERFNRSLLAMLSLFVDNNQTNWDTLLPYVMMAYRSSVHASTGFTPYKVLFGREIVLPVDLMLGVGPQCQFNTVSDYVARTAETLSTVVEAVKRHQAKASGQQKAAYDFRANFQYYSVGERVWVRNKARTRGLCPKLQRRYKGPYKVLERVTDVLYRLALEEGGPDVVIHYNRLKPFFSGTFADAQTTATMPGGGASSPSSTQASGRVGDGDVALQQRWDQGDLDQRQHRPDGGDQQRGRRDLNPVLQRRRDLDLDPQRPQERRDSVPQQQQRDIVPQRQQEQRGSRPQCQGPQEPASAMGAQRNEQPTASAFPSAVGQAVEPASTARAGSGEDAPHQQGVVPLHSKKSTLPQPSAPGSGGARGCDARGQSAAPERQRPPSGRSAKPPSWVRDYDMSDS